MKRKQNQYGLTLIEILVALTIMAILAASLYSVGNYMEKQSRIKLTESTIELLCAAIGQYKDTNDVFPFTATASYNQLNLVSDFDDGTGIIVVDGGTIGDYNDVYSSSEALYYFLNRNPESRRIISSINRSLLTNEGEKGKEYFITIAGQNYPLIHIVDPWKYPFRYEYKNGDNFPVITSAGPDRNFGLNDPNKAIDNISSR